MRRAGSPAVLAASAGLIAPAWAGAGPSTAMMDRGLLAILFPLLETAQGRLAESVRHAALARDDARRLAAEWSAALQTGDGVRSFTFGLVIFIIAGGLEWMYWTYAVPALRDAEASAPGPRAAALKLALRTAALRLAGAIIFGLALLAASAAFAWPPGVQDAVVTMAVMVTAVRVVRAVAFGVLQPGAPRLRLVSMGSRRARRATLAVTIIAALLSAALFAPDLLVELSDAVHLAASIQIAGVVLASALVYAAARASEKRRPAPPPGSARRRLHAVPRTFWAVLWLGLFGLLWAGNAQAPAATLLILTLTAAAEAVARRCVLFVFDALDAGTSSDPDEAPPSRSPVLRDLTLRFARFVIAVAGLGACAWVWGAPLFSMDAATGVGGVWASRILGALALALLADMAWAATCGAIDSKLDRIAAVSRDPEAGSQARLVTLLPLLRKATGVAIAALLVLSALSVFGIEITPLLAGAGVVGIAVGFGAQTLVRDILSGVFYLVEDVFRIGDYIEGGGSAKGTVERITLRTVALRHQNGPLHFVPYGVLGSVKNNSRDWVIDKFEIPLPIDVDSEFVRKMVKKIGQAMLEEPEFAGVIVEPLKAKLYRIQPGVKIFRCKVQTPPGRQFEVRSEAYRRIESALREAGVRFADAGPVLVQAQAAPAAPARAVQDA
ncbi:mechanosensitive ion channel family protein [Alsobacter sp. SYSU BS001988]